MTAVVKHIMCLLLVFWGWFVILNIFPCPFVTICHLVQLFAVASTDGAGAKCAESPEEEPTLQEPEGEPALRPPSHQGASTVGEA